MVGRADARRRSITDWNLDINSHMSCKKRNSLGKRSLITIQCCIVHYARVDFEFSNISSVVVVFHRYHYDRTLSRVNAVQSSRSSLTLNPTAGRTETDGSRPVVLRSLSTPLAAVPVLAAESCFLPVPPPVKRVKYQVK